MLPSAREESVDWFCSLPCSVIRNIRRGSGALLGSPPFPGLVWVPTATVLLSVLTISPRGPAQVTGRGCICHGHSLCATYTSEYTGETHCACLRPAWSSPDLHCVAMQQLKDGESCIQTKSQKQGLRDSQLEMTSQVFSGNKKAVPTAESRFLHNLAGKPVL